MLGADDIVNYRIADKRCTNLFSYALRPNVGKLANPQPSPEVKNHWKKPHKKLKEKNLPNALTCFLVCFQIC